MVTITEYQQKLSFVVGDVSLKVAVRERSLLSGSENRNTRRYVPERS